MNGNEGQCNGMRWETHLYSLRLAVAVLVVCFAVHHGAVFTVYSKLEKREQGRNGDNDCFFFVVTLEFSLQCTQNLSRGMMGEIMMTTT